MSSARSVAKTTNPYICVKPNWRQESLGRRDVKAESRPGFPGASWVYPPIGRFGRFTSIGMMIGEHKKVEGMVAR